MKNENLIIIPAYNESGNIVSTIEDIRKYADQFDYIIINDCSTDDTLEICRNNHYNYINLPINLGIGGAVQTGYRYAFFHNYKTAVQFDGDGQHDSKYLKKMLQELNETDSDMVIGSRFIEKEGFQSSRIRRFGIRYFSALIKIMTKKTITDPTSGMRMVNSKLLKEFTYSYPKDYPEPESSVYVISKGYKVSEIPVVMKERVEGESSINIKAGAYYMLKVSLAIFFARIKK